MQFREQGISLGTLVWIAFSLSASSSAHASICGDFELVPSPTTPGETSLLTAAETISTDDVWAVGTAQGGSHSVALHWDGASWSETATPNPSDTQNDLRGVAAFSSNDVWAVGGRNPPAGSVLAFVIHWDGEHWSQDSGPSGLEAGAFLWSVRRVGSDLWAVGTKVEGAPGPLGATLAARRRGGSWEVFSTPNIGNRRNEFLAVDGSGPNDVWGVGDGRSVGAPYRILLAHWDGSAWSNVDVPSPGANDFLRGVAAVSSNDVWAAGEWYDLTEGAQPLLLHWDGSGWSRFQLPVFPQGAASLEDIFAISGNDIWAVGTHATDGGVPRPLLLHWDGLTWTQTPGAPGLADEWFRGVTAAGACDVWAVGQFFDGQQTGNLTERLVARNIVDVGTSGLPGRLKLRVAPNPISERVVVSFALDLRSELRVSIVRVDGRLVRRLTAGPREAGPVILSWDRRAVNGSRVAPGIYFLRVEAGNEVRSTKLVVR